MARVNKQFSFGWAQVKAPGEAASYATDLSYFRRDMETGREIDNDEVHGVKNGNQQSRPIERTFAGD